MEIIFNGRFPRGIIGNVAAANPNKNVAVILYENKFRSVEFTCPSEGESLDGSSEHTIEDSFPACLVCPKLYQGIRESALNLKGGFTVVDIYSKDSTHDRVKPQS